MSDLQAKFKELHSQLMEKIEIAEQKLKDATDFAREHGIPFSAGISPLYQCYTPEGWEDKWEGLDEEFIQDITDNYDLDEGDCGWQHSAVC